MGVIRGEWDGERDARGIYMLNTDISRDLEYDRGMNWGLILSELHEYPTLHTWRPSIENRARR